MSTICTNLYTEGDHTFRMIQREGGSISLYYTLPHTGTHFVIFDTMDDMPPNSYACGVLARLGELHTAIGALLNAAT